MPKGPNTEFKQNKIDWKKVGEWLQVGCTGVECADMLGISDDNLYQRCPVETGTNFRNFKRKKRGHLRHFIRQKQKELAAEKSCPMLIWMGKQYCEQKEPESAIQVTAKASAARFVELMEEDIKKEKKEDQSSD